MMTSREFVLSLLLLGSGVGGANAANAVLTNAAAVHQLAAETAAQHLPVRLDGVVTHYNSRIGNGLFIQDATDGIYIRLGTNRPPVVAGDHVIIEGQTATGDYAPVVQLRRWQRLGQAALPPPERVNAAALASGRFDCRRVEVRGIVRSAEPARGDPAAHLVMQLRADGQDLFVGINTYPPASTNLVDAEVIVRGVVGGNFSWQRQLLSPVLLLDTAAEVEVISPPQSLAALPWAPIQSLFGYSVAGFPDRRVRLRGQLLGQQPGKWLAVRDATSGLFVETPEGGKLTVGDELELVGFPELREQTLWLRRAVVQKVGWHKPPSVVESPVGEALKQPCKLRRLTGTLVGNPRPGEGSWVLNLHAEDSDFEAWVPATDSSHPAEWREGARFTITGITEPFFLPGHRLTMFPLPRGLRLHASSAADVRVVVAAPWWTNPRLARTATYALMGALVLLGTAVLVATLLARKNAALRETRKQLQGARDELSARYTIRTGEWHEELTARHAAEADFALLTAERTRLARELHDTLEQSLASVALLLDAAKGFLRDEPKESDRYLDSAVKQLRESQSEIRRSIWNLRSVALEKATLPEALSQLGEALADAHGPVVQFHCEGEPANIPPGVASHLFRIAQEGVTNALKHAQAGRIEIRLAFRTGQVELAVQDDGGGFDPTAAAADGRFGLRGLNERALALGAELKVESAVGRGAVVRVIVPRAKWLEAQA
jgi:signal transduction histidine kinase